MIIITGVVIAVWSSGWGSSQTREILRIWSGCYLADVCGFWLLGSIYPARSLFLFFSKVQIHSGWAWLSKDCWVWHTTFWHSGLLQKVYVPMLFPVIHRVGMVVEDIFCAYFLKGPFRTSFLHDFDPSFAFMGRSSRSTRFHSHHQRRSDPWYSVLSDRNSVQRGWLIVVSQLYWFFHCRGQYIYDDEPL